MLNQEIFVHPKLNGSTESICQSTFNAKNPLVPKNWQFEEAKTSISSDEIHLSEMQKPKKLKQLEHAALWLFMFLFVFDYHFIEVSWWIAAANALLEICTYAAVFYLNYLLLIPNFLKKNRRLLQVAANIALVIGYIFLMRITGWEDTFYELGGWRNVFSMLLNTSLFLLLSTLFWYFEQWQIERERQLILKTEKLEAELKFLRSQISPHFIFNTLNNIYSLIEQKHENAAPMVGRLSTLLRYVLYDSERGQVKLSKEIETLRQFIELNLLRKPRSQNVDFFVEGNLNGWQISPMLLINFVENCFKHSNLDSDEQAFVNIHCEIGNDGILNFSTENSVRQVSKKEFGGIGLPNLRRQLDLDFPEKYELQVGETAGIFRVNLILNLKKQ